MLLRLPPLRSRVPAVRTLCTTNSGASSAVTGISEGNLWVAMMRKVQQPALFLPSGMEMEVELHETGESKSDPIWRCLTFASR